MDSDSKTQPLLPINCLFSNGMKNITDYLEKEQDNLVLEAASLVQSTGLPHAADGVAHQRMGQRVADHHPA